MTLLGKAERRAETSQRSRSDSVAR